MIIIGIQLALLGMCTVYLFLIFMILLMKINGKLCAKHSLKEQEALKLHRKQMSTKPHTPDTSPPIAVITAAITCYNQEMRK